MGITSRLIEKVKIDFDTNIIFFIIRKTRQCIMVIMNIEKLDEICEISDRHFKENLTYFPSIYLNMRS